MTVKPIRWFEVTAGAPPSFHNHHPKSCVVCLNYKDYDNLAAGVEPWFLTNSVANIILISEWGPDGHWGALERGAQQMVDYAESDDAVGFKDGDFYGIFWVMYQGTERRPEVRVGLAYADSTTPLISISLVVERSYPNDEHHRWITPQFAIPLQVEVQLMGEAPKVIHRVSRYKRTPVI